MQNKITWKMIFEDFRRRHPRLSKDVIHWSPKDYLTIELRMKDKTKMSYDYHTHTAKFM